MQNTAYWVNNSRYSSDLVACAPLLKDHPEVSEQALCQEIISIYFGEEEESDSALSSSCLDNSFDGHDSSSSSLSDSATLPLTLETNLDEFSTPVYIPVKTSVPCTLETNLDDFSTPVYIPAKSSVPCTLETNLDDFSTAVYIPAKTYEAHTRKITSGRSTRDFIKCLIFNAKYVTNWLIGVV
jgi:hypothetical protein